MGRSIKVVFNYILCIIAHGVIKILPITRTKHYDVTIVRSDAIGDFIMWLGAIDAYKSKYKDKRVLLICPTVDKLIADKDPFFSEIMTFDRTKILKDIVYFVKSMLVYKGISSDIVLNPAWGHQFAADYLCGIINSPVKIGYKVKREITIRNRLDKILKFILDIGVGNFGDNYFTLLLPIPDQSSVSEFAAIEAFTKNVIEPTFTYHLADLSLVLQNFRPSILGNYCLISLSSSTVLKDWPVENLSELIIDIPRTFQIVLTGYGDLDENKAHYIINNDKDNHIIKNFVNKTNIIELIGYIAKSSFVISNDSAAVHIAAACRVRSLCFMHGAHFGRFVPYPDFVPEKEYHPRCVYYEMDCFGCGYNCKYQFDPNKPFYCLRKVSTTMAKRELFFILNSIKEHKSI